MKVLGFLKNVDTIAGTAFDLFDVLKFGASDGLDFSNPLSFPGIGALGPVGAAFSLINGVAGMLVKQIKDEQDAFLEESVQQDINKAKLLGLEATRKEINSWNHNENLKWQLENIYEETANKLLQGQFETLNELLDFNSNIIDSFNKKITILYRSIKNENKEIPVEIIESIFINE